MLGLRREVGGYVFRKLRSFTEFVLKIKYEELSISRFIRCNDSLNEHGSVNVYFGGIRGTLASSRQIPYLIFKRKDFDFEAFLNFVFPMNYILSYELYSNTFASFAPLALRKLTLKGTSKDAIAATVIK